MSKNLEAENLQKTWQRDLTRMTFRQQNTYALKMSQSHTKIKDEEDELVEEEVLDYDQYFKEKKRKRVRL